MTKIQNPKPDFFTEYQNLEFLVTLAIESHFDFLNVKVQHSNPSQI